MPGRRPGTRRRRRGVGRGHPGTSPRLANTEPDRPAAQRCVRSTRGEIPARPHPTANLGPARAGAGGCGVPRNPGRARAPAGYGGGNRAPKLRPGTRRRRRGVGRGHPGTSPRLANTEPDRPAAQRCVRSTCGEIPARPHPTGKSGRGVGTLRGVPAGRANPPPGHRAVPLRVREPRRRPGGAPPHTEATAGAPAGAGRASEAPAPREQAAPPSPRPRPRPRTPARREIRSRRRAAPVA